MKNHIWLFKTKRSSCMNTREIASEYRLAHWAQAMQDRTDRGLSIRAYCEEAGIHVAACSKGNAVYPFLGKWTRLLLEKFPLGID